MSNNSVILYDDGDWSKGHYAGIFLLYLKACLNLGMKVSAVCPHPELLEKELENKEHCSFHKITEKTLKSKFSRLKPLTRALWWISACHMVRKIQEEDKNFGPVFFMNTNHLRSKVFIDQFTDHLFPFPWATFTYDSSSVRSSKVDIENLKDKFNFLSLKNSFALGVTDEKMILPLKEAFPEKETFLLPDTTFEKIGTSSLSPQIKEKAKKRKIVALLGVLHKRKGLITALKLAEIRPDLFFLFVGELDLEKMSEDEKTFVNNFISSAPKNCFFHLKRIEEESEFNALINLSDIIFAVYPRFTNSSGLLTKAGMFSKPVLVAAGDTCMADLVEKYDLGTTANSENLKDLSNSLTLLQMKNSYSPTFKKDFGEKALETALSNILQKKQLRN